MLGVGDTSLVVPDWLLYGVTLGTYYVQTSKTRPALDKLFHQHAAGLSETSFTSSMQTHRTANSSVERHCDSVQLGKSSKHDSEHGQSALWW